MKRKNERAITLITLVITIIIMLILAGVVLNLVIGKNGLINIAKQAGKNYTNAEEDEKRKLDELYGSILVATDENAQINISMKDLKSLIRDEVQNAVWGESVTPTGTIIAQMGNSAPAGYINCDGATYNISEYKQLAEYIKNQFGSYNYFGGDGTSTFAVPDLRGEFLRGTGNNSHTNQGNGANVGNHQDATLQAAIESGTSSNAWMPKGGVTVNNADKKIGISGYRALSGTQISDSSASMYTSRPTNTSVLYCIKY